MPDHALMRIGHGVTVELSDVDLLNNGLADTPKEKLIYSEMALRILETRLNDARLTVQRNIDQVRKNGNINSSD